MYNLIYSSKALKQLKKLEKDVQKRILLALERIRILPEAHIKKLVGEDGYKFRVGQYRIILDIKRNELQILILKIGHRRNIYD